MKTQAAKFLLWASVVLCFGAALTAGGDGQALTTEENRRLDVLTETWNRLRVSIEDLERDRKVQRYLALVELRAELQKDLEEFAQQAVASRNWTPGEAFLDTGRRKIVRRNTKQ